jgi:hypothetical protein
MFPVTLFGKSVSTFSSLCLAMGLATAGPAQAGLSFCSTDPMVYTMIESMLVLSTDIGTMADRILETEDKIGEMADRIVETEELLASTLTQLTQSGAGLSAGTGVLLLAPASGELLSRASAPAIQLSNSAATYVLYVSATGSFSDGQVVPLLVTPESPLQNLWSQALQTISGNTVYMAVRSVDQANNLSNLSNAVRLMVQ